MKKDGKLKSVTKYNRGALNTQLVSNIENLDKNLFYTGGIFSTGEGSLNGAINNNKALKATIGPASGIVGGLANKAISGGYSAGAGVEAFTTLGSTAGDIVGQFNPVAGAAVKIGSLVIGGLANRAFGTKVNQAALNAAKTGTNALRNFASMAKTFDEVQGPGTVANVLNAYKGGWFSKRKARRRNEALKRERIIAQDWANRSVTHNINTISQNQTGDMLANYAALGGFFGGINSALDYANATDNYVAKMAELNNKNMTNMFAGTSDNILAFGGNTESNGATWSDGMTHINVGGSHEENPNEGVQLGVDNQGTPNLVEEGEVIYNDYVFSNRLTIPVIKKKKDLSQEEKVLKKYSDTTYAKAAKRAEKDSGVTDRPNDSIAKRGFEATLQVLATSQEREREKQKLKELQEAIDNMSPEELAALQQLMQAMQQQSQEEAIALQQAQQQQVSPEEMQLMSPEEAQQMQLMQLAELMQAEQQPIAALGGLLNTPDNMYPYGGNLEKFTNELKSYGLTLDDFISYWNESPDTKLTDDNFNKRLAEKYIEHITKALKEVARRYKKEGLNPKNLTGAGLEAYQRDVVAAARGTSVADGDLSINGFSSNNSGDAKVNDFNRYSYTRNTRLNLIAGGATELKPNAQGQFDINYGIENPTGLTYVTGMPKWNTSSQQWEDAEGKKIDNPFGADTKFSDVTGGGYNSAFENQDALSQYYKDQIAKRFQNLKGENYDANRLPNYYLSKEELGNWITDLEGSNEAKDKELARMLRANWNLDADNLVESDAYLGLPATQENRLQRDAKPGIEHIPYLDAIPYSGVRYREVDASGNPTDNYVNWDPANPTAGFSVIEQPLSVEGGVTTYGIKRNALGDNVGVLPDGTYVNLTPDQAALYANNKIADPSALPQYTAPLAGYDHNATYYDLSNDAAGNPLGVKKVDTDNDPFPKAPSWPYLAAGLALLGALGYNILSPSDYSNANALIKASQDAGNYAPISFRPIGNKLTYNPMDIWFELAALNAQSRAGDRNIMNTAGGNRGTAMAGLLANNYNSQIASGNLYRKALEYNDALEKQVAEFNKDTDKYNSEGFLKADMANQDAFARAQGFSLEGQKAGYAMKQAIDDAKAASINAGINGLINLLPAYAQNKYNQDMIGWGIRNGAYASQDIGHWAKKPKAEGGKIKRNKKKGLNF